MEPFNINPEMASLLDNFSDEEDLFNFAALQQEQLGQGPANDEQIELGIYTCFLVFKRTVSIEHLEQAIQQTEVWVTELAFDHPDRSRRLQILDFLSACMSQWEILSGSPCDTELAFLGISQDMKRKLIPEIRAEIMNRNRQVAIELSENYQQTSVLQTLDEAISIMQRNFNLATMTPNILNKLAVMLGERFERTGSMDDINRAIEITNILVNNTPKDDPGLLNNLGRQFGVQFSRTNSINDLNYATKVADMAENASLEITIPQGYSYRAIYLQNLGVLLCLRFDRTGSVNDLNRAIEVIDMAMDAALHAHDGSSRIHCLSNLGTFLGKRFERTGSIDDLNRAVEVSDMAVNTSQGNHDRGICLNNLGNLLARRFERTGSIDDLNRAVEVTGMAVDATPQDHPNRARRLNNLGISLEARFNQTGSIDDLNCTLYSCTEGWLYDTATPSVRI